MAGIIVAFPKRENAIMIRNLLVKKGYSVIAICTSGSAVLSMCDGLESAIIITGYKLPDMMYYHIKQNLDDGFEMILIASADKLSLGNENDIVALPFPLRSRDLFNTVDMLLDGISRAKRQKREEIKLHGRSKEERETIEHAKKLLMEINRLTEQEAHRYIQKTSMDSGSSMVETAKKILTIMYRE